MLAALVLRMRPPTPLAGRLATQSLLFALGEGAFMTGSAFFFIKIVGLTGPQVGLGLTIAGIAGFIAAYPMGRLVNRFGPKRCWAVSSAGQACLFGVWPFIEGFDSFVAMVVAMEVVGSLGGSAHGAYTVDVLPPEERVTSRAYMYSALNVGFTLGAGLGLIGLSIETATGSTTVIEAVPWFTALVFVVNAAAVLRLPDASHDAKSAEERRAKVPGRGPLLNLGWMTTTFFVGVLWTNQVLLNLVIPLWLVERTDAPGVLLAFLFCTNTVMCIFLPMAAARGIVDVRTALRAARISCVFFVASCLTTAYTHDTAGWVTIALVWLGHVTVTGAELYLSAASWSFEAELMDPRRRGDYQGAAELSGILGKVWAPALYTFLVMDWGSQGWFVIAAIVVVATAGLHVTAPMGQRFLVRIGAPPPNEVPVAEDAAVAPPGMVQEPPLSPATGGPGPTSFDPS
jgi:MFS family permease